MRANRAYGRTTSAAARRFGGCTTATCNRPSPRNLGDTSEHDFYRAINRVAPGLIRVEADELTYDLHIMLRTEIERDLVAGTLQVADLPEAWNALVARDLGLEVPDDRRGVLQDIHWSSGQIGTFCNYTIGNVMAAQLFDQATQQPAIAGGLTTGDYQPLRAWLGGRHPPSRTPLQPG